MGYIRAHIRLNTMQQVADFVGCINSDGTPDKYIIESFDGTYRADARSRLGVLYAMAEYNDETYLVNIDNDGVFPLGIDTFRA